MEEIDVEEYHIYGIKNAAVGHSNPSQDYVKLHTTLFGSGAYLQGNRVTLSVGPGLSVGLGTTRHLTSEQAEELGTALLYYAKITKGT